MGRTKVAADRLRWRPNVRLIEESRLRRCWTLRRLSQESQVSYPTIINLLWGRTKPTFGTLDQIARALSLSSTELVTIVGEDCELAASDDQARPVGT